MYSGKRDVINSGLHSLSNSELVEGINLNNFTFVPMLEATSLDLSKEGLKFLETNDIIKSM